MVEFYKDPECTERLTELKLDDSYIEDVYGGVLDNVVEVGTTITKTVYVKNPDADMVVVRGINSVSPFVSAVLESARLGTGEITPLHITFRPTVDELKKLEGIEDMGERRERKERLLNGDITLDISRVTMI